MIRDSADIPNVLTLEYENHVARLGYVVCWPATIALRYVECLGRHGLLIILMSCV